MRFVGILGILAILGIAYLLSTDRKAIKPRLVAWGLGIQMGLALFILKTDIGQLIFKGLGDIVSQILHYSDDGSSFIFGRLVTDMDAFGFIFAFKVLPAIIFVGALMNIAYYLGVMQFVVSIVAKLMVKTLGTSGAESLSAVGTVFVGQSEAPLLIKPYIGEMTKSELMAIMTGGMATIAGSVMAAYIGMLGSEWAPHLLAASIMGAPAGLVLAKIMVPETDEPKTQGEVKMEVEKSESSVVEAAAKGALDGMHLAFIVGALLIAFIALIALINGVLANESAGYILASIASISAAVTLWKKRTAPTPTPSEPESEETEPSEPIAPTPVNPPSVAEIVGGVVAVIIATLVLGYILTHAITWVEMYTKKTFSMQLILGYVFSPLTFLMGVPMEDVRTVGALIGQKIVLNEFVAYSELSNIIKGQLAGVTLTPQGITIATFALCGFANFSSIAINIGCIGGIAPERRGELAVLGPRAMLAGALASCLTATIAGLLVA